MTRHDMKNPNQNDTEEHNLSGSQSGGSFKGFSKDAGREGKSQGQAYERAGGNQDKSQKGSQSPKGSDWTPGDDSDVGTRFDKTQTDAGNTAAKRGPGRERDDE